MLSNLITGLRELVFPDNCLVCRTYIETPERQLCESCFKGISLNRPPFYAAAPKHPVYYDCTWAACPYQGLLCDLIHSFKYNGKTSLRKTFFKLMTEFIDTYHVPLHQFDVITPIPLHAVRLRERGFNQSRLLSQMLCDHYNLTHKPDLLKRTHPTQSQTLLTQKQRWTNLEGAFKMNSLENVSERSILLVDDLLTTGATANAAAACLKQSGTAYVGVLTLSVT